MDTYMDTRKKGGNTPQGLREINLTHAQVHNINFRGQFESEKIERQEPF